MYQSYHQNYSVTTPTVYELDISRYHRDLRCEDSPLLPCTLRSDVQMQKKEENFDL